MLTEARFFYARKSHLKQASASKFKLWIGD